MTTPWDSGSTIVTAVAGAFAVIAGGWQTLRLAKNVGTSPAPLPPGYQEVVDRVKELEKADAEKGKEIYRLNRRVNSLSDILLRHVPRVLDWAENGAGEPVPTRSIRALREAIEEYKQGSRR